MVCRVLTGQRRGKKVNTGLAAGSAGSEMVGRGWYAVGSHPLCSTGELTLPIHT